MYTHYDIFYCHSTAVRFLFDCCLENVYLAALYYTTEQYQTAIDHCTLVTRTQDHPDCTIDLNTSQIVELLHKSAVEHLTTFRQLELWDFSSIATIVTTGLDVVYAYKSDDYSAVFTVVYTEHTHAFGTLTIVLVQYPLSGHCKSLFSCQLMTLSRWLHWHWLSVVSRQVSEASPTSISSVRAQKYFKLAYKRQYIKCKEFYLGRLKRW